MGGWFSQEKIFFIVIPFIFGTCHESWRAVPVCTVDNGAGGNLFPGIFSGAEGINWRLAGLL
jgi:hypothetical protein